MKIEYITPIVKSIEMDRCLDPLCLSIEDYSGENGGYDDDSD